MIMNSTLNVVTIEKEKVLPQRSQRLKKRCRLKSINSERWDLLHLWVELY